ncbi:MAG: ATP-binding protein [Planctomycetales bacterium]|nr:ATP-binding protein [Planctomycetales bacterium]
MTSLSAPSPIPAHGGRRRLRQAALVAVGTIAIAQGGMLLVVSASSRAGDLARGRAELAEHSRAALRASERALSLLRDALGGRADARESLGAFRAEIERGSVALVGWERAADRLTEGGDVGPGADAPRVEGARRAFASLESRVALGLRKLAEGDRASSERLLADAAGIPGSSELSWLREWSVAPGHSPGAARWALPAGLALGGLAAAVAGALFLAARRAPGPPARDAGPPVPEAVRAAAITSVAAGVAHELRNPLFGMSAAAQVLREAPGSDPEARRAAEAIATEVRRLDSLLKDLLDYSHPRAGHERTGDPDAVVRRAVELEGPACDAAGVRIELAASGPAMPVGVGTDRLRQVVANLLRNAVEATPRGGTVRVACGPESGTPPPSTPTWSLRVWNDAVVPPEVLARAFDLFYSTKPRGTGLGLPICRRIVEEADGTIRLASAPGEGTRATVRLPSVTAEGPVRG